MQNFKPLHVVTGKCILRRETSGYNRNPAKEFLMNKSIQHYSAGVTSNNYRDRVNGCNKIIDNS